MRQPRLESAADEESWASEECRRRRLRREKRANGEGRGGVELFWLGPLPGGTSPNRDPPKVISISSNNRGEGWVSMSSPALAFSSLCWIH
ncbi:hypothetical protein GOODEAATRI_030128 [Goodea atripinnis]|uniref:Uncharacterized protein n=1 Tax=Goodea atripinnis TaxID=208336 RepID=A0ABV0NYV9_9TELE